MKRAAEILLLAAALAIATWLGGWTGVPLVAFLWGAWRRDDPSASLVAGIAAPAAWVAVLAAAALSAPVLAVADRVGGLAGLPGPLVVLVMLVFAGGLAWSAAEVGSALLRLALRGRPATE
ncbi:MAG TPA: hypothetical protein VK922_04540 [Gemmatimonadaceae bacterium]|nr:hypothetical protein [Gemmatimonadaceae bacterium]